MDKTNENKKRIKGIILVKIPHSPFPNPQLRYSTTPANFQVKERR
jgi:hypothetical protein